MADKDYKNNLEHRRKKHKESFSNYENAVTVVSSLEAWFEFRWGPQGKERAGLLDYFDRFPDVDGLTPDFEVKFHTPYYIWGDYKRTVQPADKGRDDAVQIIKYALRRPPPLPPPVVIAKAKPSTAAATSKEPPPKSPPPMYPNYDVVVLVMPENDDIAAEAIHVAREAELKKPRPEGEEPPSFAPVIVLDTWHGGGACEKVHARLWIAKCGRDCDGTPLYWLSRTKIDDYEALTTFEKWTWGSVVGGFTESALTPVEVTPELEYGTGALEWDDDNP